MKTYITICILFSCNIIYSQNKEIEILSKKRDELENRKTKIIDSIKIIESRINYLKSLEIKFSENETNPSITKTKTDAKIKDKPDIFGNIIGVIPAKESIKVFTYNNGYWLIEKDSLKGYTSEIYLEENQTMHDIKSKNDKDNIIKKYGKDIANKIFEHQIWIGMSSEMTILSIGYPESINKTTGSWGVHEQWVYKNKYLYFENGVLTSWQE